MNNNKSLKTKEPGSVFLVAIIIGIVVLTAGLGVMSIFAKELKFSSDFVFSEMAYYAAESGVEKALLMLKKEPVQHLIPDEATKNGIIEDFGKSTVIHLKIDNLKDKFDFDLAPKKNVKFRLKKDINLSKEQELKPVTNWKLAITDESDTPATGNVWSWKIACLKTVGTEQKTISLQGKAKAENISSFKTQSGKYIDENGELADALVTVENFFNELNTEEDKNSCFFSATNITEDNTLSFTFENNDKMSPHKTTITSIGKNNHREKIIKFDYAQKNLGGLFDFVLFHSN